MSFRADILEYAKREHRTLPEHLWQDEPTFEVLRHAAEASGKKPKWYGIFMEVSRASLGLKGEGTADVLNVKLDPDEISILRGAAGYLPAWHMNKQHWITILLDGTVPQEQIIQRLEESFDLTKGPERRARRK